MAAIPTWQIHWQVPFISLNGIAYTVNIYDWNYAGSIVTLKGGPSPFVTHEDDIEDAFTPLRTQSGYINIVLDPDNSAADAALLEEILPTNDRSRLVRLMHTQGGSTIVDWQGFLKCAMYTQPWEGSAHMVQLPVQSMVAALESIELSASDTSIGRLAGLLTHAMHRLIADDVADTNGVASGFMGDVYLIDDSYIDNADTWLYQYIDWKTFLQTQNETDESVKKTRQYGKNWREILEEVCKLFGLTLRERGRDLYFTSYDCGQHIWKWTWTNIKAIAANTQLAPYTSASIGSGTLPDNLSLRGADNAMGLTQGRKKVSVILSINTSDFLLKPTEANGNGDAAIDVGNMNQMAWGQPHVYVQPHDPINDSVEIDSFYRNNPTSGPSTFAACKDCSVLAADNLAAEAINAYVTGCFPCRWSYQDDAITYPALKPGIFFNQRRFVSGSTTLQDCYTLKTAEQYTMAGGWLNIGATIYNFWLDWIGSGSGKWWFGDTQRSDHTMITIICCSLSMGNKEWKATLSGSGSNWAYNKGEWVNKDPDSPQTFWLIFDGNDLRTNKTADILSQLSDGYFIPIATAITDNDEVIYTDALMTGAIELKIWNVQYLWSNLSPQSGGWVTAPSRIMSDLNVVYSPREEIGNTDDNANYYRRKTGVAFKGDETVNLSVGTNNANSKGRCFILGSSYPKDYIQTLTYTDGSSQTTERPEIHLLSRLEKYYKKSREWLQAVVDVAMDVWGVLYDYSGRKMMGVNSTTEWNNDRKTVKFIEVTDTNA